VKFEPATLERSALVDGQLPLTGAPAPTRRAPRNWTDHKGAIAQNEHHKPHAPKAPHTQPSDLGIARHSSHPARVTVRPLASERTARLTRWSQREPDCHP